MSVKRERIQQIQSRGVVVRGNDIDTDRVIPARYMKVLTFADLGKYAFYDVRFDQEGKSLDHPFNRPERQGAGLLVVNSNFGCGSSREHAPQALAKWGIRALVGESFAEIFAGNCTAMGIPAVTAPKEGVEQLQALLEGDASLETELDLDAMEVRAGDFILRVTMPPAYRNALILGTWDSTGVLLENREAIGEKARSLPYLSGFPA